MKRQIDLSALPLRPLRLCGGLCVIRVHFADRAWLNLHKRRPMNPTRITQRTPRRRRERRGNAESSSEIRQNA